MAFATNERAAPSRPSSRFALSEFSASLEACGAVQGKLALTDDLRRLQPDTRFASPSTRFRFLCFYLRASSSSRRPFPRPSTLPPFPSSSMPITAEQASLWSPSGHADALIPIPQGRLTVADTLQILDFSVAVVHCFLPSEEAPAIFSISGFSRENQLCRLILEKVRSRRATLHGKSGTAGASRSTDADISFRRGYGHENEVLESNRNVPFLPHVPPVGWFVLRRQAPKARRAS
ncbi:hypothetical protein BCR35DRAFT_201247 [Leucosporidium creatinivorum]|uniref:Uncharacterized protein n=1 Tax=Leucosporidium creatinivorum TaxID=106004 RepID=A0A1Y2DIE8_9BASI|nr:hypothetical protein BCR35DRAFT_201247 [Leucosporidium creatinivorum]